VKTGRIAVQGQCRGNVRLRRNIQWRRDAGLALRPIMTPGCLLRFHQVRANTPKAMPLMRHSTSGSFAMFEVK
jgi:hypothetical protein